MAQAKITIDKVVIYHETETQPDLSDLGEYSNKPGPADRTIDRKARGDCGRNEYRYFIAAMSGDETGNPESVEQDYRCMEDYNKQARYMLRIHVVAVVSYDCGQGNRRIERLSSGGLWGIESDSSAEYLASVERDELADLKSHLETFSVDCSNFAELAGKAEHKEN